MSEPQLTDEQSKARPSSQRWLAISGAVLVFVGLYISVFLIPDVIETASGPQTLTLAQAAEVAHAERTYARIEDGAWDCDTLRQVRGLSSSALRYGNMREETKYSDIFFTNDSSDVVVFVTLSGDVNCDDLDEQRPTGYLYSMNSATQQELTNDARLARYFTTDTFLEFCGYCGQSNSLIGAVFGVVFLLAGVGLIVAGRRAGR